MLEGVQLEVSQRYVIENVWIFIVCYFLVALDSQIIYINAPLRSESIDASSRQIAGKTRKLFTHLGGQTQLRQSIVKSCIS